MTTTTPGVHGFHGKQLAWVLAAIAVVAAIVFGFYAIVQWADTETRTEVASSEATITEAPKTATASAGTAQTGLAQALADGKLDAGIIPTTGVSPAVARTVPEAVVVYGEGSLFDDLAAGKYEMDYAFADTKARQVSESSSGLDQAFADGKFDEGWLNTKVTSTSPISEPTPSVSGGPQE